MDEFTNILHEDFVVDRQGRKLPVHVAEPETNEVMPALILAHEIFGVNDHIRDLCDRFAQQGLRVYAPELFSGTPSWPEDPDARNDLDTMRKVWAEIPDARLIDDLKELFKRVRQSPTVRSHGIGTIGYCMGGAIAFMFACHSPELAFVIDYYGRIKYPTKTPNKPKDPIDYIGGLNTPFLGIFSGIDELIPQEHREQLAAELERIGVEHTIKVFDNAPHAFFNDTRETYREDAAREAWQMTIEFIHAHAAQPARQKP
ncbi:MAG TPA: dienelactone hydrolase family protein [Candidatus Obscuribacterales bacterium]